MKKFYIASGISAFITVAVIIGVFHPREHSFWGNTFFAVPYYVALFVEPPTIALVSIWVTSFFKDNEDVKIKPWSFGAKIGALTFFVYIAVHSSLVALIQGPMEGVQIFSNLILFGILLFLPICSIAGGVAIKIAHKYF